MPLPPSPNPISLFQIQTEFDGTNPISISEYYEGAPSGYVTSVNYTPPGQIPASGPLSFSFFHGVSKITYTIFYASGTYAVPAGVTEVQVLAIGGGGGGGGPLENTAEGGGGGGGGAVAYSRVVPVTPLSNITVTVGAGGTGGNGTRGTNGSSSSFGTSLLVAAGGGSGGGGGSGDRPGASGGNGGGGCGLGGATSGGLPTSPNIQNEGAGAFGQSGGRGGFFSSGGGGGGAWERGFGNDDGGSDPAKGGNGANIIMTNNTSTDPFGGLGVFGGGGGGGATDAGGGMGPGGVGGGGNGAGFLPTLNGEPGTVNTGGGGGGARNVGPSRGTGGNGGSGIVVVATVEPITPNNVYPTFQSYAASTDTNPVGTAFATSSVTINTDGTLTLFGNVDTGGEVEWFSTPTPGIGNSYWARFAVTPSPFSDVGIAHSTVENTWYQLSSPISFAANANTVPGIFSQIQSSGTVLVVISTTNNESGRIATGSFGLYSYAEGNDSGGPPP